MLRSYQKLELLVEHDYHLMANGGNRMKISSSPASSIQYTQKGCQKGCFQNKVLKVYFMTHSCFCLNTYITILFHYSMTQLTDRVR